MTYASTVLADSPVGFWQCNDAAGATSVFDSSGNAHHGVPRNGPTFGASGFMVGDTSTSMQCTNASANDSAAGGFRIGTGFDIPASSALAVAAGADFTWEVWAKPDDATTNGIFLAEPSSGGKFLGKLPNLFRCDLFASSDGTIPFGTAVNHVVIRRISGVISLFINNALDHSNSSSTTSFNSGGGVMNVGTFPPANDYGFQGRMKDVAFYATGLSDARIAAHYAAGTTVAATLTQGQNLGGTIVTGPTSATVTAATPSGGGTPTYAWHLSTTPGFTPGSGTLVAGQTGITATFNGLTPETNYYAVCVTTDGTTTVTSFQRRVRVSGKIPLRFGSIGDSTSTAFLTISDGTAASTTYAASEFAAQYLRTCFGNRKVISINAAVAGANSIDWVSGSSYMNAALAAFTSGGLQAGDFVFVRLGVNDAQGRNSASTFSTNMTNVLGALTGAGYKVLLSYPTHREPGVFVESTSLTFDDLYSTLLPTYLPVLDGLVNSTTIFAGDRLSESMSAAQPVTYFKSSPTYPGSIHPSTQGEVSQGINEANALLMALGEPTRFSGHGGILGL